jgi:CRP/FNR family transcriptional regulator, cyclic AMP receptor protein
MSTKLDFLETINVFQDLTPVEIEDVGQQTTMASYQAGHIFYMPNDPGEVLFVLKQGRVQLYRISPDGRKLVVAELNQGAIFGHMALVGQHLHSTFAEALDNCLICAMSRVEVERLLVEKPQVALRFLESIGQRLFDAELRLEESVFKRIPARLAGLLIRLNKEHGSTGTLKGYTHQYLADMLGTYRETTTQTLNDFQSRDLIRIGRKSIEILNKTGLEEVASTT